MKKRLLLSGNEAVALGAYEAGVTVGTGYPGTPSSEILPAFKDYPDVYAEWSVNEKVALEVALGAAFSGARAMATMKHVGVNVAADPLFTSSYTGVSGALVIVVADEPNMHSSQNEQDSRNYALAAKIPMLEPSDSQEAKDFVRTAVRISEEYDTPVFIRSTTRLSHSKSTVIPGAKPRRRKVTGFRRDMRKYVMIPAFARPRHGVIEERLERLSGLADSLELNTISVDSTKTGFITSGIAYQYVREVFPEASVLKLGMVHPLPWKLIDRFIKSVENVYVAEELDPFLETLIKAKGYRVEGKKYFPLTGEFSPGTVKNSLRRTGRKPGGLELPFDIPPRPPSFCPGCPHKAVFQILKDLGKTVSGDIGCYTLSVLPPLNAMDTCVDMGASVTVAQGMEIAMRNGEDIVSVIGDSTFAHSGITGLLNAAYNGRTSLVIVLDNGTTAMTGMQPNPLTGERIDGCPAPSLDYRMLASSMGIGKEDFLQVGAYDEGAIRKAVTGLSSSGRLSLLVVKGECIIHRRRKARAKG